MDHAALAATIIDLEASQTQVFVHVIATKESGMLTLLILPSAI
jgi:hypothetical protein